MTTEIANRDAADMGAFSEQDEQVIRYLGLNPNSPADRAMVAVCRTYNLDPVLKHVVVIPKGGVYVTRDGLLHIAHRSGMLDGIVVEQDPTLDKDTNEWVAKVTVYRKDMRYGFSYPGRYPVSRQNKEYAPEMALKCAEAHALRRAFDVTGIPAFDERKSDEAFERVEHVRPHDQLRAALTPVEDDEPDPITAKQLVALNAAVSDLGLDREAKLAGISVIVGRTVESSKDLTKAEAGKVIDSLHATLANRRDDLTRDAVDSPADLDPARGKDYTLDGGGA